MNVGCILMAAGAGQRFGGDKLLAEFKGAPLYAHALACIPAEAFAGVAVVAHAEAVLSAARRRGFCAVYNSAPEAGVSRTIALGMDALAGMDALLFLVADQPLLRPESVRAQIAFFRAHPITSWRWGMAHGVGIRSFFQRRTSLPCVRFRAMWAAAQ